MALSAHARLLAFTYAGYHGIMFTFYEQVIWLRHASRCAGLLRRRFHHVGIHW